VTLSHALLVTLLSCAGKEALPCPPGEVDDGAGGCAVVADTDDGGDDTGGGGDDTGPGGDDTWTGGDDTGPGGDDTDTEPVYQDGDATLSPGEVITCGRGDRDEAPLELWELGGDWAERPWDGPGEPAGGGVMIADIDGDGRLDIALPLLTGDRLYMTREEGLVDETAARWPAGLETGSVALTAADYDGDGDLDLLTSDLGGDSRLLANDGAGHFTDVTEAAGLVLSRRAMSAAWGDMDGDGDLDLAVAYHESCFEDPDRCDFDLEKDNEVLWENLGDGTFASRSERLPSEVLIPSLMHVITWLDVDGDGDQDLYVTNDDRLQDSEKNHLFFNDGAGNFTSASDDTYANVSMHGMGMALGALNGDGLPDLVMTDTARIVTLESLSEHSWYDGAVSRGLTVDPENDDRWNGWGVDLVDLDNDGDLDLPMGFGWIGGTNYEPDPGDETPPPLADDDPAYEEDTVEEQPDAIYLQDASGWFTDVAPDWGTDDLSATRATVGVDLDGDGFPELIKAFLDAPARVYRARCDDSAWLTVHLRDDSANTFGVGARVVARSGDLEVVRWVHAGGTGVHTSVQPLAQLGLGDADTVEVEITWPDGEVSTFKGVDARQVVTVHRGADSR
jgi:hypothetical protein